MSFATNNGPIQSAFVTGATGLLGNNLVRLLVSRGVRVRALARSREKAAKQFGSLPIETVVGSTGRSFTTPMSPARALCSFMRTALGCGDLCTQALWRFLPAGAGS